MVFPGRQRGRGRGGGGGILSATTRKSNVKQRHSDDRTRSRDREISRSPSPDSKRPVLERLGPKKHELVEEAADSKIESLRITVGNEIYKERRNSPLRDRLGPPVEELQRQADMYEEERMYYSNDLDSDRRDLRKGNRDIYNTDRRKESDRRGDDDRRRESERRRDDDRRRENDRRGDDDRRRESDRRGDDDRRRESDRRGDDDRRRESDRRGDDERRRDMDRRGNDRHRDRDDKYRDRDYRERDRSRERERRDVEDGRDRREQDKYRESDLVDPNDYRNRDRFEGNYRMDDRIMDVIRQARESSMDNRPVYDRPPQGSPRMYQEGYLKQDLNYRPPISSPSSGKVLAEAPKPLKSILKKSTPAVVPGLEELKPSQHGSFPPFLEGRLGPSAFTTQPEKDTSSSNKAIIPGLGNYIDVEDEEAFLYGDSGSREQSYIPDSKVTELHRNLQNLTAPQNDPYSGPTEPIRQFYQDASKLPLSSRGSVTGHSTFPVLDRTHSYQAEPPYESQKSTIPEPQYHHSAPAAPVYTESPQADLLSIFTNKPTASIPASIPSTVLPQNVETTKANYDPTIENILKSIGFDFEMSKRMQEKAKSDEVKPKEEPELKGINQTASFLGGGLLDDDLKDSLFMKKDSDKGKSIYDDPLDNSQSALLEEGIVFKRKKTGLPGLESPKSESVPPSYIPSHYPSKKEPSAQSGYPNYGSAPNSTAGYSYTPTTTISYAASQPPSSGIPMYTHPQPITSAQYGYDMTSSVQQYQSHYDPHPQSLPRTNPNIKEIPMAKSVGSNSNSKRSDMDDQYDKEFPSRERERKRSLSPKDRVELNKSLPVENIRVISALGNNSQRLVLPPKTDSVKGGVSKRAAEDWESPRVKNTESSPRTGVKRPLTDNSESKGKGPGFKSLEKLKKEKEIRQQRIQALEEELQKLRKQQNEIIRKKRRQKDGHKDPILMQNSKLQEEIALQISKLRKATEENEKRLSSGDSNKVGEPESKKIKEESSEIQKKPVKDEEVPKVKSEKMEKKTTAKDVKEKLEGGNSEEKPKQFSFQVKGEVKVRYEFFDQGAHWCKSCNEVYSTLQIYLQHLHQSKHLKSLSQYDKPWVPEEMKNPSKKMPAKKVSVVPLKGAEFIMPATGFWCSLCKVLLGDQSCGEFHLKTDQHHDNYKAFIKENPFHEQRRNLDKATALSQKKEEHLKQEAQKKFELNKAQKKIDERIKSKVRSSEKEVKELDDLNEDQTKCSSLTRKQLAIRKSSKEQTEVKGDQESELKKAVDEAKKAIEVKLYAKKVNVPGKNPTLQPSGKSIPTITHGKRNPVLPPWNPVSLSKTNTGSVVGEKKLVTAEDILKAFTGKTKAAEKEKEDEELKKKKEEERKLIEDAKKNEEMMKQQSSENVATTCQNVLPLKPRPAKYDWEKPKSVPILSVSKASLEVGTNSQSQKIQNTSSGSTEAVNPIATVAIPLPDTITQNVASNKEQNIVKNKINENSKNNSTESEVKQTSLCSDNITENYKIEAQSHDKILEEENMKHTGSSQNKVGELVEISNDSSSNDSVVVPMENLDIPKTLVPAAPPPAQDTEMLMVVADIHSDEESVASSISMHMGSDFEVIDDLEQP